MEVIKPIKPENTIIDRIPPPVVYAPAPIPPVVQRLEVPVIDVPIPRIDYPKIELPPREPTVKPPSTPASTEQKETTSEPTRQLSDYVKPSLPKLPLPQPPVSPVQKIPVAPPKPETTADETKITVEVAGYDIDLPAPETVIQAGATAVIGASATLVTALVFNQVRQAATPVIQKLARDKFKIKLKKSKPVLHLVEEDGKVLAIEYSDEGVKVLNNSVENPEQYLRDLVETDPLFEADHKIVIDEPAKSRFTKEGAKRFNYFLSPKKFAKKLTARFTF